MIVLEKLSQNILDITNQSNMTDEEKDAIQTLLGMFMVHHSLTLLKLQTSSIEDEEVVEQPKPKRKYTRRKKEQTNEKTENSYPVEQSLSGQTTTIDISV